MTAAQTLPLLESGMRLSSEEFLRRWYALPDLKSAELINGVVHIPQYVTVIHGAAHGSFCCWLGLYLFATPGIEGHLRATWLMDEWNVPQPDLSHIILPEYGGQSTSEGELAAGAPEFILEVSDTDAEMELGEKLKLYESMGVQEYVVAVVKRQELHWFYLMEGRYCRLVANDDGIHRSILFPGLWLDSHAFYQADWSKLQHVAKLGVQSSAHAAFVTRLQQAKKGK